MIDADRRIAVGLFILAFVAYAWFFGGGGWNQNAHFDLARALVERGTFHIDGYHVNTGDVSWNGGHFYINKPPGASMLAAIPYALLFHPEKWLHAPIDSFEVMTANAWVVTALTCGVTGALIPSVLYLYLRRRANVAPRRALLVALTAAFGTLVFPYSTMLFAQVPATLFFLLAFVLLDERPLLAGAAAGAAGITFLLCIPAAIALGIALAIRSRAAALRFVAGGLPFAIFIAVHQSFAFGSPFRTSLQASPAFIEEDLILGVFRLPSIEALHGLTFREFRGLFIVSPVLLLAFAGAMIMIRRRVMVREVVLIVAIFAWFLLATASFNGWHGGSAFGPRYLLPALPLLAIPLAFVWRPLVLALAIASAAIQFLATAVDPGPSQLMPHPLRMYLVPAFLTGNLPEWTTRKLELPDPGVGKTSLNRQAIDEIGAHFAHPYGSREAEWASFNAGEFFAGPGRRSSVFAIALWIIGGSIYLARRART